MTTASLIERRRALAAEGRVLVGAILARPPGRGALRRYVAGAERFQDGIPLVLPAIVHRFPALIRAFEPVGGGGNASRFAQRLALAMRVAEATPPGAALTHPVQESGLAAALLRLALIATAEAVLMPVRLILGRRW
ncbi:hypothetical protein [Magnetospirillum sp. SS-4]|uniref:hypothetical protein n=1 Tax=Magnetospirillum sp. SS-4 TaxID=2681465 RepID=UPI001386424F|nr:hypothetical protein [Magnetospirillum sp. SS-4]CAA7621333.1 hypothetical protein MTBSS4_30241 [Magnetospirillum sp. SS-4]